MNALLAATLTNAHSLAWRRRYGTEFRALLEELPATPAVVASASGSALSSRAPALAMIGAFALAIAVLAFGPAASDRQTATVQTRALHPAHVACANKVAFVANDGANVC
jgi:uncharacterized membrane protein YfcA